MDLPQRTQRAQRKRVNFGFRIADCGLDGRLALCVLCAVCGELFLVSTKVLATQQEVVPINGASFRGELVSVDAGGRITFRVADDNSKKVSDRMLTLDELVRWGNPLAPRPQTIVLLADGGRIMTAADWAGG